MINIDMLREKIVERRTSAEALSSVIGISKDAMFHRLQSGGSGFTIKQVNAISDALNLAFHEKSAIFLPY